MEASVYAPFTVARPGKVDRVFKTSREAVEFLIENPGVAYLYGPSGLILTKGELARRGGMRASA